MCIFRQFLHISKDFRQFLHIYILIPHLFVQVTGVDTIASQNEQIVAKPIDELALCGSGITFDHPTLCSTANSTADMATDDRFVTERQHKAFHLGKFSLHTINP